MISDHLISYQALCAASRAAGLSTFWIGIISSALALIEQGRPMPGSHAGRERELGISRPKYNANRRTYEKALALAERLAGISPAPGEIIIPPGEIAIPRKPAESPASQGAAADEGGAVYAREEFKSLEKPFFINPAERKKNESKPSPALGHRAACAALADGFARRGGQFRPPAGLIEGMRFKARRKTLAGLSAALGIPPAVFLDAMAGAAMARGIGGEAGAMLARWGELEKAAKAALGRAGGPPVASAPRRRGDASAEAAQRGETPVGMHASHAPRPADEPAPAGGRMQTDKGTLLGLIRAGKAALDARREAAGMFHANPAAA